MSEENITLNLLALDLLERLKIVEPSQAQIDAVETLISISIDQGPVEYNPLLTTDEKRCLFWSAKGKTHTEITELTTLDTALINNIIKSFQEKLGAKDIVTAVQLGMRLGKLIQPPRMDPQKQAA